jgi:hypothetical protein
MCTVEITCVRLHAALVVEHSPIPSPKDLTPIKPSNLGLFLLFRFDAGTLKLEGWDELVRPCEWNYRGCGCSRSSNG